MFFFLKFDSYSALGFFRFGGPFWLQKLPCGTGLQPELGSTNCLTAVHTQFRRDFLVYGSSFHKRKFSERLCALNCILPFLEFTILAGVLFWDSSWVTISTIYNLSLLSFTIFGIFSIIKSFQSFQSFLSFLSFLSFQSFLAFLSFLLLSFESFQCSRRLCLSLEIFNTETMSRQILRTIFW